MKKLYFRYGAMNSGKTSLLLSVVHNYREKNRKVILIKPGCDTKGENKVVSRTGLSCEVDYVLDKNDLLKNKISKEELEQTECIIVDEAQFLTREQINELFMITKMNDIPVICYGLRTDYKSNAFPGSQRLFELADELEEIKTICDCGKAARFNARIVNGEYTLDGNQVAIDGVDNVSYNSLCGKCYIEKVLKLKK